MKQCRVCGEWKQESDFYFRKDTNQYRSECGECGREYKKKYREEHIKEVRGYEKKYYQEHKEKKNKQRREHRKNHGEQIREYKKMRLKNPKRKLNHNISNLIRKSLRGRKNGYHWEDKVDYTLEDLMTHLKTTIPKGFSWQDYMGGKLHIDHKIPVSLFNFESYEHIDFKKCWALENLQLLEAKENISKSNKINDSFQPSLKVRGG